jgi:hypothetical protein
MKARYCLLGCLALTACDAQEPPVVVNFAQPFPADAPDLPGFLPRHRGRYPVPSNIERTTTITAKAVLQDFYATGRYAGFVLDSLGIPRRRGRYLGPTGSYYEVQAIVADSFQVREESRDTLLSLTGPGNYKLRHYRGWYYFSTPTTDDSTKWDVQRVGVVAGEVVHQIFNPDSLRILALDPTTVQRHHSKGQLIITLAPKSRSATSQVTSYSGLWLTLDEYMASMLKKHCPGCKQ